MVAGHSDPWFQNLGDSVENVEKTARPRYVKSHLPWSLLPDEIHVKKPKVSDFSNIFVK